MSLKRVLICGVLAGVLAPFFVSADDSDKEARKAAKKLKEEKIAKALAVTRMIDARIDQAMRRANITPAPQATDEEIIRRLSLDLNGVIPPPELVVAFVKYKSKEKRIQLIEKLIESKRFDRHFANVFSDGWLGRRVRRSADYRNWMAKELSAGKPLTDIVKATIREQGPANYFARRWGRNPTDMAAQSTRVFMGLQIQCAQCHDHPFTAWKQEQFHHFAAYFSRDDNPYAYKLKDAEYEKTFEPKFLFEKEEGDLTVEKKEIGLREKIAILMTEKENPYFARMSVNRVWKAMFGRGLVDPIEDLEGNDGYHPMLLSFLAEDFVANNYDIRHLIRAIVHSRAYQRSSRRTKGVDPAVEAEKYKDSQDEEKREEANMKAQQEVWLFARASLRPLTPRQIAASLLRATGQDPDALGDWVRKPEPKKKPMKGKAKPKKKGKKKPAMDGLKAFLTKEAQLLRQFDRLYGDEETNGNPDAFDGTVPQTLMMFNGKFVNEYVKAKKGSMMSRILANNRSPKKIVKALFLAVLSRYPTKAEMKTFSKYLKGGGSNVATCEDIMWALFNSSDFIMNH